MEYNIRSESVQKLRIIAGGSYDRADDEIEGDANMKRSTFDRGMLCPRIDFRDKRPQRGK